MENFRLAKYRFHIQVGERGLDLPPFKGSALRGVMGQVMLRYPDPTSLNLRWGNRNL